MGTHEEGNSRINRAATPIRYLGASSAAASGFKSLTLSKTNLRDMVEPIKNETSKPQHCKAADILRFLFSFCGATAQVGPMDDEHELKEAFSRVQELANEPNSPLREHLGNLIAAEREADMYNPLVKAFNYALDHLSRFNVPGLPAFKEEHRIVFARSDAKCILSESYLQGSCKPDIVLLNWGTFVKVHEPPKATAYSDSHQSDICCKSGRKQPALGWRNLLSTVEVKLSGGAKHKAKEMEMDSKTYTRNFPDLEVDLEASPEPTPAPQPEMVGETYSTTTFGTYQGSLRSEGKPSASSSHQPQQKRSRDVQSSGGDSKRPKIDTSGGKEMPSESLKSSGLAVEAMHIQQKQPPRIQSAIYAAHKMSSSFDVSHTIGFTLIGTSLRLTWIDRQNIIESRVIDVVDDLPYFLLLLLVLQRFDHAKWGHFTHCPQSGINVVVNQNIRIASFLANSDTGKRQVSFYPEHHEIHLGTTLTGRGTSVIGAREGLSPTMAEARDTPKLRNGNDLVVKIYWPEEGRESEVEILKKAKEYGEDDSFITHHIPDMVGYLESDFLCSSTKTIRQFLGLPTEASRRLRIIVFRRLVPIKMLKEIDMLTAYLQCFFCHFCLWKKGIYHGDISLGNLMWDDVRKVGVLNDFDLAKFENKTSASGRDNTGTLPFMALDLLSKEGLRGDISRLYRHEAESFAWTLIYLYLSMVKNPESQNYTRRPHPLKRWLGDWKTSRDAKEGLKWREHEDFDILPVYPNTRALARALHKYWLDRYRQQFPDDSDDSSRLEEHPAMQMLGLQMSRPVEVPPYEEPKNEIIFRELVAIQTEAMGRSSELKSIETLALHMILEYLKRCTT